jgi:hypothetical protein
LLDFLGFLASVFSWSSSETFAPPKVSNTSKGGSRRGKGGRIAFLLPHFPLLENPPPFASKKLKLFPRKTMTVQAGKPVDLSDLYGQEITSEVLKVATSRIMDAITKELAAIRNETPPAQRMPWTKERP